MNRVVISSFALLALLAAAQDKKTSSNPTAPQQNTAQPAQPGGTGLQAKSPEEYKAFQEAVAIIQKGDPVQSEAAADAFADKFKGSEAANALYHRVLPQYQEQNNADKAIEVGNKILASNPNDPVANVMVASFISERVRETDIDRDQRLEEAERDAKRALQTVDTNFFANPGTPQERVDESKNMLRSLAYTALANCAVTRLSYAAAENYFKQAIAVPGAQIDSITWLRYALLLDKEKKYSDALNIVNKAYAAEPEGSQIRELAKSERDRLSALLAKENAAKSGTAATGQTSAPKQ